MQANGGKLAGQNWRFIVKKIWFTFATVLASTILVLLFVNRYGEDDTLPLPDAAQVKKISAKLSEHFMAEFRRGAPQIPEFEIPPEYFGTVLAALSPPRKKDMGFSRFGSIVNLSITTESGEPFEIEVFWAGVNPICFSVNGVNCIRGGTYQSFKPSVKNASWHADESILFFSMIREIYRVHFEKKEKDHLEKMIEKLEISRGEKPPPY